MTFWRAMSARRERHGVGSRATRAIMAALMRSWASGPVSGMGVGVRTGTDVLHAVTERVSARVRPTMAVRMVGRW